jgi:hypothetical protein
MRPIMKITARYRAAAYLVLVGVAAGVLWAGWKHDMAQRLMNNVFVVLGWSDTGGFEPGPAPRGESSEAEPRGDVALDARRRQLTGVQTVLVEERVVS